MILSLSNLFGTDALQFARLINVVTYGTLVGIMVHWFRTIGNKGWVLVIGSLLLLGSRPIFTVASMAWSELIFIFFTIIFIITLSRYLADPVSGRTNLAIAIIAVMFACLMRYVGITIVFTGWILILIGVKPIRRKIIDSSLFAVLPSIPTGFFVLRNYWLTGTLVGERYPTNRSFLEITSTILRSFSNQFIPDIGLGFILLIASIPIIVSIIIISILILKMAGKKSVIYSYTISSILFSSIYLIYIYISANIVGFDSLSGRFLSPVYFPLMMVILSFISIIPGNNNNNNLKIVSMKSQYKKLLKFRNPMLILLSLTSVIMIISVGYTILLDMENSPGGLADLDIQNSDTSHFVINNRPEGKLYSNHPNFFFGTDLEGKVHLGPRETYQATDVSPDDLPDFNRTLELREYVILIWFDIPHDYVYSDDDLKELYKLEAVKVLDDGIVYRVRFD